MNKLQAKRLLNVAKALREAPEPKKFRMDQWGYETQHKCGSPACALGHFAARRDLQKAFSLDKFGEIESRTGDVFTDAEKYFGLNTESYDDVFNDSESEVFNDSESDLLFNENGCGGAKTAKAAALFIERFVAKKLKEQAMK